jgi:hypothetical protein
MMVDVRVLGLVGVILGSIAIVLVIVLFVLVGVGYANNRTLTLLGTPKVSSTSGGSGSWFYLGLGLASIQTTNRFQLYGEHQVNFTADLLTLDQVQKFVKSQGGVSFNYPINPPTPCIGGTSDSSGTCTTPSYFFWSSEPFVTNADGNTGWASYSLQPTL